ncbi:MAG TPA: histidine phosphatase family protein [Candidatus Bathyarchaeia archaeon]|nr:histidine phosphatase family protein [Candidatus Bathyarchaeia archaeon]
MTTFFLIRHGQKQAIKEDPSLSEVGLIQVKHTAAFLQKIRIHKVFSSPLKRCLETAAIIAQSQGLEVLINKNLRERFNWGDDPSLDFENFLRLWEHSTLHRDFQPKYGDSSKNAGRRLENLINNLNQKYPEKFLTLVAHGGVISDLIRNIFSEKELFEHSIHCPEKLEKNIKEASITILIKKNSKFILKEIGSIKHFPKFLYRKYR